MAPPTGHTRLLGLPAELRMMIYNHYFDLPPLDTGLNDVKKAADMCSEDKRDLKSRSSLVCTSRQIMNETLPIYQKLLESRIENCAAAIIETWHKIKTARSRSDSVYFKRIISWYVNAKKFSEIKLAKWEEVDRVVMRKSGSVDWAKLNESEHTSRRVVLKAKSKSDWDSNESQQPRGCDSRDELDIGKQLAGVV